MLDDCGGRGNGERDAEELPRDAEGLPRAGSKEGSGKGEAVGWTGRMGVGGGQWGGRDEEGDRLEWEIGRGKGEGGGDMAILFR